MLTLAVYFRALCDFTHHLCTLRKKFLTRLAYQKVDKRVYKQPRHSALLSPPRLHLSFVAAQLLCKIVVYPFWTAKPLWSCFAASFYA